MPKITTMKEKPLTPTLPLDLILKDGTVITYYLYDTENANAIAETLVSTGYFFGLKEVEPSEIQAIAFRGNRKEIN